jgi:hypothetical protein
MAKTLAIDCCRGRERLHSSQVIDVVALPFRSVDLCHRGDRGTSCRRANLAASQKQPWHTSMAPNSLLVFALISLSAGADSFGFIHAAKIWQQDTISWINVVWSAMAWSVGITLYMISLRYLARLGITAAEVHTMLWFAMTIIGVIVFSGRFFSWPRLEQGVATLLLLGLGWLLVRTAE